MRFGALWVRWSDAARWLCTSINSRRSEKPSGGLWWQSGWEAWGSIALMGVSCTAEPEAVSKSWNSMELETRSWEGAAWCRNMWLGINLCTWLMKRGCSMHFLSCFLPSFFSIEKIENPMSAWWILQLGCCLRFISNYCQVRTLIGFFFENNEKKVGKNEYSVFVISRNSRQLRNWAKRRIRHRIKEARSYLSKRSYHIVNYRL